MKVNVTQKNKTMVALYSLEPGDGFLYNGYPHIVGRCSPWDVSSAVVAFNLTDSALVFLPKLEQVQLTHIDVEYTV